MKTKYLDEGEIEKAVKLIQKGEIVAFPTDTVYGLGADARNKDAVEKIFIAKKRPTDRALSILLSDPSEIKKYAKDIPKEAYLLMGKFWPGSLTIVLKSNNELTDAVHPGIDTVGMRMPNHSLTLKLIEECGFPLATPSANLSGRPSPTTAEHVLTDLNGRIAAIIDGGESDKGIESTVLDLSVSSKPIILRPGGINKNQIEEVIGKKVLEKETKYSNQSETNHYRPMKPLYIVESSWEIAIEKMKGKKIGILASEEIIRKYDHRVVKSYSLGQKNNIQLAGKLLFSGIRDLEKSKVTVILVESYLDNKAYMNRLEKAANYKKV